MVLLLLSFLMQQRKASADAMLRNVAQETLAFDWFENYEQNLETKVKKWVTVNPL